jgi:5-methylcytosine-specific restriction enzyme A
MPQSLRPCSEPGCPELTRTTRCTTHTRERQRTVDRARGTAAERGYGWAWQRLRAQALRAQPWCSYCFDQGSPSNPLTIDHRWPKARGGTDELDNLQVLCHRCNSGKKDR